MRRLILTLIVLITLAAPPVVAQQRRRGRTLTLAAAQRVLNQQIDTGTADNVLFTCRACYNPDDKAENDNFPIVTYYGSISQFLARKGYVRRNRGGEEFFTAKAKRSPYFEAFGDERGGFGGAGFRFANFKNPKITVTKITDPKNVPIEYDVVPTAVTQEFFGGTKRVRSKASFSYEDGRWNVCINCGN